jgi:hypothetical protein
MIAEWTSLETRKQKKIEKAGDLVVVFNKKQVHFANNE